MSDGKLWTQRDRFGNDIYRTHERWAHIVDPDNHPEVAPYFDYLIETIRWAAADKTRMTPMATSTTGPSPICQMTTRT